MRNDATLSKSSRHTLNHLLSKGLLFTVASARSVFTIREVIKGVNLTLPMIEINGAFVTDMASGEHLVINAIKPALLPELYACINRHNAFSIIATFDGSRDRLYYDHAHNKGIEKAVENRKAANDPRLCQLNDLEQAFDDQVVSFTVIGLEDCLDPLNEEIEQEYNSAISAHYFKDIYSEFHWLTIQDKKASKDNAIKAIMEEKGLSGCEIVAFGDNDNDLPMLKTAHRAIAVENATDALKKNATQIIGSNQEQSVVAYLEEDFIPPK